MQWYLEPRSRSRFTQLPKGFKRFVVEKLLGTHTATAVTSKVKGWQKPENPMSPTQVTKEKICSRYPALQNKRNSQQLLQYHSVCKQSSPGYD